MSRLPVKRDQSNKQARAHRIESKTRRILTDPLFALEAVPVSDDPMLLQFAAEGAPGHAEQASGYALVAVRFVQGVDEPLAFIGDEFGVPIFAW